MKWENKNVTQMSSLFLHHWRYHKYVTQHIKHSISDGPKNKRDCSGAPFKKWYHARELLKKFPLLLTPQGVTKSTDSKEPPYTATPFGSTVQ